MESKEIYYHKKRDYGGTNLIIYGIVIFPHRQNIFSELWKQLLNALMQEITFTFFY